MSLMTAFARSCFEQRAAYLGPCHHCYQPTTDRMRRDVDAPLCARCASTCSSTSCTSTDTPQTRAELLAIIYAVTDAIDRAAPSLNESAKWPIAYGCLQAAMPRKEARVILQTLSDNVFCDDYDLTRALQTLHRCCPLWRAARCNIVY